MSIIEDNWVYYDDDLINFAKEYRNEFDCKATMSHTNIIKQLSGGFKTQRFHYNGNVTENQDDVLQDLIERNKELRQQIDLKIEEICHQQIQYKNYRKDQKLLSQEIKETHEAFLMTKKYYKKFLKMYYTIETRSGEKQTIFVQFFTDARKDSESYSVRLLRNTKTGQYQLLSTSPNLKSSKDLRRKLQESNDVSGALYYIRQAFIEMKINKNN